MTFPLCRTCVETQQQTLRSHSDEDRTLSGTWVPLSWKKAIALGYEVVRMEAIWHFDHRERYDTEAMSGGLFTDYVNTFLSRSVGMAGVGEKQRR